MYAGVAHLRSACNVAVVSYKASTPTEVAHNLVLSVDVPIGLFQPLLCT